jgi:hypothetical protein
VGGECVVQSAVMLTPPSLRRMLGEGCLGRGREHLDEAFAAFAGPVEALLAVGVGLVDHRQDIAGEHLVRTLGVLEAGPVLLQQQQAAEVRHFLLKPADLRDGVFRRADDDLALFDLDLERDMPIEFGRWADWLRI